MSEEQPSTALRKRIRAHLASLDANEDNLSHRAKVAWARQAVRLFLETFEEAVSTTDFSPESDALSDAVTRIGERSWYHWTHGLYAPPPTFGRQRVELRNRHDAGLLSFEEFERLRCSLDLQDLAGNPVPDLPYQPRFQHYPGRRPVQPLPSSSPSSHPAPNQDTQSLKPTSAFASAHGRSASGRELAPPGSSADNPLDLDGPGTSADNPLDVDEDQSDAIEETTAEMVHPSLHLRPLKRARQDPHHGVEATVQLPPQARGLRLHGMRDEVLRAIRDRRDEIAAEIDVRRKLCAELRDIEADILATASQ
ncbi:hypothetical protein BV25DRAFT_1922319 [Artomyces pyxidatus]|uniref:Uncharacterized protein n=1 Tax=Artomyces pyxidatus TaxID=48021 RepID=A0ACB8SED1_9AGAM|nr:hypothetical protein BV25DRAFT_1922319 [Artomyces pyxidatus]